MGKSTNSELGDTPTHGSFVILANYLGLFCDTGGGEGIRKAYPL